MKTSTQIPTAILPRTFPVILAMAISAFNPVRNQAATLTVTNASDAGSGTLRSTLMSAASGDMIVFSVPTPAMITLANGELSLTNNLTIVGPGAGGVSLSGGNSNRVFNVASNCTVNLTGLTIRDGYAHAGEGGGGIYNAGTLSLSNCDVSFNRAGDGTLTISGGQGGGVFNLGSLTVAGCTFRSNRGGGGAAGLSRTIWGGTLTAGGGGGGGAGIYNAGSLTVISSTFHDNQAGNGGTGGSTTTGEIAAPGGAGGSGGGILSVSSLTCLSCTFKDNHAGAGGSGGSGYFLGGGAGSGGLGGTGGGILSDGTTGLRNCIVALNAFGEGGSPGYGYSWYGSTGGSGSAPDVFGAITSQGHNLIGDSNGSSGLTNGLNGNLVGTSSNPINPRLGALQENGGPTWTMALLTGSPALDAGDDALTGTDQRGSPRPSGAHVDIGAFEGVSELYSRGEVLLVAEGRKNGVVALEVRSGATIGTFAQPGAGSSYQTLGPRGMLCVSNYLLVINQNVDTPYNGEILAFDLKTGTFGGKFVSSSNPNAPYAPRGIILGPNNVLYVTDFGGFDGVHPGRIARFNSAGTFLGNVVTTGLATPFYPFGLVVGPDGLLYVSGVGNFAQGSKDGFIFRFQYNAGTQNYQYLDTIVASTSANNYSPELHAPEGIVFGPDGNIYITSFYSNLGNGVVHRDGILVFNKSGQRIGSPLYLYAENETRVFAQSLLFGPRGDLFVPVTSGAGVRRYSASSSYQQFTLLPTSGDLPVEAWYLTFRATNPRTLVYEPPRLMSVQGGNDFTVSWPATYTGWQLQIQTNSLAVGLVANWQTVSESLGTNSITATRTNPFAAFRLSAP